MGILNKTYQKQNICAGVTFHISPLDKFGNLWGAPSCIEVMHYCATVLTKKCV